MAAVITAEDRLTNETYQEASKLVEKVTDNNKKDELEKRLEEVKNSIDAILLVEELEAMVGAAKESGKKTH